MDEIETLEKKLEKLRKEMAAAQEIETKLKDTQIHPPEAFEMKRGPQVFKSSRCGGNFAGCRRDMRNCFGCDCNGHCGGKRTRRRKRGKRTRRRKRGKRNRRKTRSKRTRRRNIRKSKKSTKKHRRKKE